MYNFTLILNCSLLLGSSSISSSEVAETAALSVLGISFASADSLVRAEPSGAEGAKLEHDRRFGAAMGERWEGSSSDTSYLEPCYEG